MRVGYACQCLNNAILPFRTCMQKSVTDALLMEIISHNLHVLDQILDYNYANKIALFRLSSDLIPFGSSPVNKMNWQLIFQKEFQTLGEKAKHYGMRLTMHPGQYTLLNTPNEDVLNRSILDLRYHCDILNLMEMDESNKLILHVGGVYGNKIEAMNRIIQTFHKLDKDIQHRLIIENDDHFYTLEDVLFLSSQTHIPVIFDNLHHELLPSLCTLTMKQTLVLVQQTWKEQDGRMKIHYSQQDERKRRGAHATYLDGSAFINFCESINYMDIDMMLEVKSKNLAALQANDLLQNDFQVDVAWKQYRYLILRHSSTMYHKLETILPTLSSKQFYELLYQTLRLQGEDGSLCYQKMFYEWKMSLNEKETMKLERAMERYHKHKLSERALKNIFYNVSFRVNEQESFLFLTGNMQPS